MKSKSRLKYLLAPKEAARRLLRRTPGADQEGSEEAQPRGPLLRLLVLSVVAGGLGLVLLGQHFLPLNRSELRKKNVTLQKIVIPKSEVVRFSSFMISFKVPAGEKFLSLSIAAKVKDRELREEIKRKQVVLRSVIYDSAREAMQIRKGARLPPELKGLILRRVNEILDRGRIPAIYLTECFVI